MAGETLGGENDVLALQALRDSIPPDALRVASQQLAWDMPPAVVTEDAATVEGSEVPVVEQGLTAQHIAFDECPGI